MSSEGAPTGGTSIFTTLSNIARSQVSVPLNSRNSECTYRVELNDIQFVLFEVGLVPLGLKKVK